MTDADAADEPAEPTEPAEPDGTPSARTPLQMLVDAGRPRASRGQLIGALLCGVLGFALVTQVHSAAGLGFTTARQSDLVDILDSLSARSDQLRAQIATEQTSLSKLTGGTDQTQAALDEAQSRAQTLQILAGTVAAMGPGIELQISDPQHQVGADVLLEALEELRDAGAEAIQITGSAAATGATPTDRAGVTATTSPTDRAGASGRAVRLVASSYFLDATDTSGVIVDGVLLAPPYDIIAIGDPQTITTAMGIPGGVLETLTGKGATGTVIQHDVVRVTALHVLATPQYARPAPALSSAG
ncbi:MAG TPA: DUF881 domain-containing protein [Acidothermaceae bacterium]